MTDWLYESSAIQGRYELEQKRATDLERRLAICLNALHLIANDYVELSYDKIRWQRDDHMKTAKKAYGEATQE